MRSRSGRTFVTLLMFIPLIAIPLMAVFGIPEFSLVNRDDPLGFSADSKAMTKSNLGQPIQISNEIPDDKQTQPFANTETSQVSSLQGVDPFQIEEKKPAHAGLNGWAVARQQNSSIDDANSKQTGFQRNNTLTHNDGRHSLDDLDSIIEKKTRTASNDRTNQKAPFPEKWNRDRTKTQRANQNSNSTDRRARWQFVIGKLRKIGIEDYTLKPGSSPGLFHFSCAYTPSANVKPKITHRFEAESDDPLEAVDDVIEQIEKWLQQNS